jgi:hypothetical protein
MRTFLETSMSERRLIRLLTGGAVVAPAICFAVLVRAQGVLVRARDRARQAVSGNDAQSSARPHCDNTTPPVTADVVTRYVRALQARDNEIRRLAQQNTPVGRFFAAQLTNDSMERRRNDLDAETGPDWERRQALQQRLMTGDASAAQPMTALAQELDRRSPMPAVDWDAMSAANTRLDSVTMQGGGFGFCEWNGVMEVIPSITHQMARNPGVSTSELAVLGYRPNGVPESEAAAVRAHRIELIRLLKLNYKSDEMIARAQRLQAQQDSTSAVMNTWNACRQRVMGPAASPAGAMAAIPPDSMRVWQQQAQDAQKRGDTAALMALGQKMQAAMGIGNPQQQAMAEGRAQQQCGPMPGAPR